MSAKLDALYAQYKENKVEVEKQSVANDLLANRLAEKQNIVFERMKNELLNFAKYFEDDKNGHKVFFDDIMVDMFSSKDYRSRLYVSFEWDNNVQIKCTGGSYRHDPVLYDLEHRGWQNWIGIEEIKQVVAENWNAISQKLETEIEKILVDKINKDNADVIQQKMDLLSSIDKVTKNIDVAKRKDILLCNAISLFIDETFEQYDDKEEWFEMLQNELGCSVEELEELGIKITADGGLETVEDNYQNHNDSVKYKIAKEVELENFKNALECLGYNPDDYTEKELLDMFDAHYDKLGNDDTYNAIYNEVLEEVVREHEKGKSVEGLISDAQNRVEKSDDVSAEKDGIELE